MAVVVCVWWWVCKRFLGLRGLVECGRVVDLVVLVYVGGVVCDVFAYEVQMLLVL